MNENRSDRLQRFTMTGTPLLAEGRSSDLLAVASQLWVHAKVYAEGGERGLHSHPTEDHLFFLLAGRALFHAAGGESFEVGAYDGVMVPRGVQYSFEAIGDENLVIVRVGAGASSERVGGKIVVKHSQGAGGVPAVKPGQGVPIPGRVFTAPR